MKQERSLEGWSGAILSGLLMVLAFEPWGWWWCGWLALAPAWYILRMSGQTRATPFRHGYVTGLIFIIGSFWWVGAATLAGISFMAVLLSIYPALWLLLTARLLGMPTKGGPLLFRVLVLDAILSACFWVTLEWLRSWFMTGFNWNELGVSQVPNLYARQLASLGGVPLLSFVLVLSGIFGGEASVAAKQRRWKAAGGCTLAVAILFSVSVGYGFYRVSIYNRAPVRTVFSYACIQPNIPEIPYAHGKKDDINRLELAAMVEQQDLSAQAIAENPDLLIWPESITTQRFAQSHLINQVVDHIEAVYHGSFLLGSEEVEHDKLYNTAFLLGPDRSSLQRYRKVYLVVFGEYLPATHFFPWLSRIWGSGVSATPGREPGHFNLPRQNLSFAPLMCFEDTQPSVVDAAAAQQPDFFVTLINAGWYTGTFAKWCLTQHLENATLRCVEHARPMIRCADTGISCEIDALGRIIIQLPVDQGDNLETRGILNGRLVIYQESPTYYDKWGDWVGLLSKWATLAAGLLFLVRRRPKKMTFATS